MLNNLYVKGLVLCAIFSLTCAQLPDDKRVSNGLVGGRNPKPGEVKYIVAVQTSRFLCGGGIIGDRFILTAAHCVKVDGNTLLKPIRIIAGTNVAVGYNKAEVIQIDVEKAYLPKVYKTGDQDDIAVLKLKKPFNFMRDHSKVQLLNLPEPLSDDISKYPTYENALVKFAGYGNTRAEIITTNGKTEVLRSGAGRLQVAKAIIVTNEECKQHFKNAGGAEMCLSVIEDETKQRQQGTCKGDSGSPAVYNGNIVIGLDSKGIWCDNNKAPSLFTRVSSYIPFIKKAMSGDEDGLVVYDA